MGSREAVLVVGRPMVLCPFTSVTTGEQSSTTPDFEYLVTRVSGEGYSFILLPDCQWPSERFVYIFVDSGNFSPEDTLAGYLERYFAGNGRGNLLCAVVRVDADGKQAFATGKGYKNAVDSGLEPVFVPFGHLEYSSIIEPELVEGELVGDAYAVTAPSLISSKAVHQLEQRRPAGVPVFGTGMGLGVEGVVGKETPANARWVFPVIDPILVADNLARKFNEACDNFLAASQQFERPPPRTENEKAARERGELQRLKKVVADNLIALKKVAPRMVSIFDDNLEPGYPEAFLEEHERFLAELAFERERAAYNLIAWLESEVFALADEFWLRDNSKPAEGYDVYVCSVCGALARLVESARGAAYLCDLRRRTEEGMSPIPSGVVHVVSEYVFRDSRSSDEQKAIAEKVAIQVFGAWTAFLAAALAVEQRVVRGRNPTTSLEQDLKLFVERLSFVFHDGFLRVRLDEVPFEVTLPREVKTTVVSIPTRSLVLGFGDREVFRRTKLSVDHVNRICAVLNFGLAYASLRSALQEQGDERAKHMAISDLAGASLGIIDAGTTLPAVQALRDRFSGKINLGGALVGNRVSGTLGLLGAIASLTSASLAASQEIDAGDWDKAMAHMTEGVGALLVGTGSTIILVSGTTGPFALWTIGVGTGISVAGFVWSVFAADTELDTMLKFCAFGRLKGRANVAPGWALSGGTFAGWNPNTVDGLRRQLKAFQQVFYSFEVSGAAPAGPSLASDGTLRLMPSSLRARSSFRIRYKAVYASLYPASRTPPREVEGAAVVEIGVGGVRLIDYGKNYEEEKAVKAHKINGRDVLDVRFRLRNRFRDDRGLFMELDSLTCFVQLRVEGGADEEAPNSVLVVPSTSKGAREVAVAAFKRLVPTGDPVSSLKDEFLH